MNRGILNFKIIDDLKENYQSYKEKLFSFYSLKIEFKKRFKKEIT